MDILNKRDNEIEEKRNSISKVNQLEIVSESNNLLNIINIIYILNQ